MADSGCCPPTPSVHYNTKRVFYHLKDYSPPGIINSEDLLTELGDNMRPGLENIIKGEAPQVDVGTNPDWYTVIDVATLTQDLKPVQQNEAYVINLEVIDISFSDFQKLFYPTFGEFIPNKNLYNTPLYEYINNTARKVIQVCDDHRGLLEPTFNLYNELVKAYELTLGVKSECWLPCSLTKLHSSVAKVNNLLDVGGCCNVKCALTFEEFVLRAIQNGVSVDDDRTLDNAFEHSDGPFTPECHSVIVAAITAEFKSTTPGVPDVHVNWPFKIDWDTLDCKPSTFNITKLENVVADNFQFPHVSSETPHEILDNVIDDVEHALPNT